MNPRKNDVSASVQITKEEAIEIMQDILYPEMFGEYKQWPFKDSVISLQSQQIQDYVELLLRIDTAQTKWKEQQTTSTGISASQLMRIAQYGIAEELAQAFFGVFWRCHSKKENGSSAPELSIPQKISPGAGMMEKYNITASSDVPKDMIASKHPLIIPGVFNATDMCRLAKTNKSDYLVAVREIVETVPKEKDFVFEVNQEELEGLARLIGSLALACSIVPAAGSIVKSDIVTFYIEQLYEIDHDTFWGVFAESMRDGSVQNELERAKKIGISREFLEMFMDPGRFLGKELLHKSTLGDHTLDDLYHERLGLIQFLNDACMKKVCYFGEEGTTPMPIEKFALNNFLLIFDGQAQCVRFVQTARYGEVKIVLEETN